MADLPASKLWPIVFALAAIIAIVLFIALSLAVRQQKRRYARIMERQRLREEREEEDAENRLPALWEILGEKKEWRPEGKGKGEEMKEWNSASLPISVVPLPFPPGARILPSQPPSLLISVLIAHPRRPSQMHTMHASPSSFSLADDEIQMIEDEDGVEVEFGVGVVDVEGDWRKVTGVKSLGFLE